jgi:transcriptional regulator with XRE-family HTH domain
MQSALSQAKVLQALLREKRTAARLRQSELAEKIGVTQPFVSKYEAGERRLDILELRAVCNALGLSLPAFLAELEARLREADPP